MVRAAVSLCGIELDNPVIPASGTFGYGYTFAELYDIDCLGTFSFKGTTREQRLGNAQPRIFRVQGVLGALPRQAEESFRGGENSPEMQKRALFALLARLLRL